MIYENKIVGQEVELSIGDETCNGVVINYNNWTENDTNSIAVELDTGEIYDCKICEIKPIILE
jgi:hypothetical protein